jgi:hypothetical protein
LNPARTVKIDPRARRAYSVAIAELPTGAVYVENGGEVLRVRDDGSLEQVLAGHLPRGGAASDPANARRAA